MSNVRFKSPCQIKKPVFFSEFTVKGVLRQSTYRLQETQNSATLQLEVDSVSTSDPQSK